MFSLTIATVIIVRFDIAPIRFTLFESETVAMLFSMLPKSSISFFVRAIGATRGDARYFVVRLHMYHVLLMIFAWSCETGLMSLKGLSYRELSNRSAW